MNYSTPTNVGALFNVLGKDADGVAVDLTGVEMTVSNDHADVVTASIELGKLKIVPVGPVGAANVTVNIGSISVSVIVITTEPIVVPPVPVLTTLELVLDSTFPVLPVA